MEAPLTSPHFGPSRRLADVPAFQQALQAGGAETWILLTPAAALLDRTEGLLPRDQGYWWLEAGSEPNRPRTRQELASKNTGTNLPSESFHS